jgi:hypothetical protein
MSSKKILLISALTLGAGVGGASLLKKVVANARVEGMIKGCNTIVGNTVGRNPFLSANCEMRGDVLALRISNMRGQSALYDAETTEVLEETGPDLGSEEQNSEE